MSEMATIILGASIAMNTFLVIRCLILKKGAEGLIIYMKKKEYTPPTREETTECIREAFTNRTEL